MTFQCANCQRPFGWHCDIHVIPCCPGKCLGKENRHLGPLEDQSPGRLVSGGGHGSMSVDPQHLEPLDDTPEDLSVKRMVRAIESVTDAFEGLARR